MKSFIGILVAICVTQVFSQTIELTKGDFRVKYRIGNEESPSIAFDVVVDGGNYEVKLAKESIIDKRVTDNHLWKSLSMVISYISRNEGKWKLIKIYFPVQERKPSWMKYVHEEVRQHMKEGRDHETFGRVESRILTRIKNDNTASKFFDELATSDPAIDCSFSLGEIKIFSADQSSLDSPNCPMVSLILKRRK